MLFSSSVLNLAELVALRPDLQPLTKLLYFHENQLVYPTRQRQQGMQQQGREQRQQEQQQQRDFQYGYNQVLSWFVLWMQAGYLLVCILIFIDKAGPFLFPALCCGYKQVLS